MRFIQVMQLQQPEHTQEEILSILGRDMVLIYLKCYSNISTDVMLMLLGTHLYLTIFYFYLN